MKSGLLVVALSAPLFAFSGTAAAELESKVASAWYAEWHKSEVPLAQVPWDKYTRMTYAFAITTPDPAVLTVDETGLDDFVSAARNKGVKPMVSIGGWTGSLFFSTAVGSQDNRTTFVKTVTDLAQKHKLDGLDFDWEFPNDKGVGCNLLNPDDAKNFQLFFEELRRDDVGKNLTITVAAGSNPWLDGDRKPLTDVSGFAEVLDFVAIMNYDIWGPWSEKVGPNAPLNDACGPAPGSGSALSAVNTWTRAGMPPDKIVLGVPSYGHSFRVRREAAFNQDGSLALNPPFDKNDRPSGDQYDGRPGETDVCGVTSTTAGGIIQYSGMISLGHIGSNGTAMPGRVQRFDDCSQTPILYFEGNETMISYDDPESMRAKGKFIKTQTLRGFSMWEVGGDANAALVSAIRSTFS